MPLLPGEERLERPGFVLWLGRDASWNSVQRVRLPSGGVAAAVDEVRSLLRERRRGPSQWEFGPSATPEDLEEQLQTMMVLLHAPTPAPEEIEARAVASVGELAEAFSVMTAAFGGPSADEETRRRDAELRWQERNPELRETFVALLDGRIVGAATASYAASAVQLNAGAVLPHARGRGVYRALVSARWHGAQARGLDAAVTQAGTMSQQILSRLGFVAVGEIRSYVDAVGGAA